MDARKLKVVQAENVFPMKTILVIGDLNIDHIVDKRDCLNQQQEPSFELRVGGTAFNAAVAFKQHAIEPRLIGKIGKDREGNIIKKELQQAQICSILQVDPKKQTGICKIILERNSSRGIRFPLEDKHNANDYDIQFIEKALEQFRINDGDLLFVTGHFLIRSNPIIAKQILELFSKKKARVVFDLVPHNLYELVSITELQPTLKGKCHILISEFLTFQKFVRRSKIKDSPDQSDWSEIFRLFASNIVVLRYGFEQITKQQVRMKTKNGEIRIIQAENNTGYSRVDPKEKTGFGDKLTAQLLNALYR